MDQARLGKEIQVAMREKEDEAAHWKRLYVQATKESGAADAEAGVEGEGGAAGALGVDETVKLRAEVGTLFITHYLSFFILIGHYGKYLNNLILCLPEL